MILFSGFFPPLFAGSLPGSLPLSAPPMVVLSTAPRTSWVTSCTAWLQLPSSLISSDQRPKFCGVTSDLKPSVCCPCVVTIQAGPRPLSMSHVYMLKLIDLRLPPGYPIRNFLGTSNSSTWLDSATPSQFIFPVMPCQSQWIHFASCYPPQKCKQQL